MIPARSRLPAGVIATLVVLALATSLAMRFATPETVSWATAVALFVGFLVVPAIPTIVFVSMAARPRPGDVLLVLPYALLPFVNAVPVALPVVDALPALLMLGVLLLMAIAPVVAAVRGVEGTVYLSLFLSGLAAFAFSVFVVTRSPDWASDDGLGQAFFLFFMWMAVGIHVVEVLACAAIRALIDRRHRPALH